MLFETVVNLMRGEEFDGVTFLVEIAALLFVVFCLLPIHEFAHAWMAVKLGDETPRLSGRLTLRPMAHLDPIGALMIFLFGIGYAKPVPVNPSNFKNPRSGFAVTALAGPLSNLIMAFISFILAALCFKFSDAVSFLIVLMQFFYYAAQVNISLAVFNLLPIPPLDGSRIFAVILPQKFYFKMLQYERYIQIALFVLLFSGILTTPLNYLNGFISKFFWWVATLITGLAG